MVQELLDLMFGSFSGQVVVDTSSPYSGTDLPIGTADMPVNNFEDARKICHQLGLNVVVKSKIHANHFVDSRYKSEKNK